VERDRVVDVVPDVLLVGEELVNSAARPWPAKVRQDACRVQGSGDLPLRSATVDEHSVHASNGFDFIRRPWYEDNSVGLKALLAADLELALRSPLLVDKLSPQAVARHPALAKAQANETALSGEHLDRQLAGLFAGHRALNVFNNRRAQASVVLKLLGAVVHRDARLFADELVVGALVGVLESAPTTDVVNENRPEISSTATHV